MPRLTSADLAISAATHGESERAEERYVTKSGSHWGNGAAMFPPRQRHSYRAQVDVATIVQDGIVSAALINMSACMCAAASGRTMKRC